MNLIEIFTILIAHFLGDYILQSDYDAQNKSKFFHALLSHTVCYLIPFTFLGTIYSEIKGFNLAVYYFVGITFIVHTIQDYFTSRLNSKLHSEDKRHLFFISLGFDQLAHYVQLFLTYYLLFK